MASELAKTVTEQATKEVTDMGATSKDVGRAWDGELPSKETIPNSWEGGLSGPENRQSDFDGIDYNQNPEQLDGILDGFKEDNWENFDLDEKKELIKEFADFLKDAFELKNPPNIEYFNADVGYCGYFDPENNIIGINENILSDPYEVVDTVAHESYHAKQHECAENPQCWKDFQYQHWFENYIDGMYDFEVYESQFVEAEARAIAERFKDALAQSNERA